MTNTRLIALLFIVISGTLSGCYTDEVQRQEEISVILKKYVDPDVAHIYIADFNSCEMCYARLVDDFSKTGNKAVLLLLTEKEKISLSQNPYLNGIELDKIQLVNDPKLFDLFVRINTGDKLEAIRIDRGKDGIQNIKKV